MGEGGGGGGGGTAEREERVKYNAEREREIKEPYISCSLHVQAKILLHHYVFHNYSILFSHIQT